MRILIINGANLGVLGFREPEKYGSMKLDELNKKITENFPDVEFEFFQSNSEGEIVDRLNSVLINKNFDGIIINPGAFTHYSYAIRDAIEALDVPVVEVHMTNIYSREEFRRKSVIAPVCRGHIAGFGYLSYILGVEAILKIISGKL